ncbi:TolC family protein [Hirschia baltica]|uniref:Outer membrane efflux protein n=1 Tax=Hirschia baltica (strain ATCC 49814 / DSM 5838 / IFAM 1418) TaxID=582402 RepID=C6XPC6_HIRBI|nr:TolC family protein [Hirschia baltica]ACT58412.1 outer membrane efflux protein [Hirschia baltica ATCC 49814]
MSFYLRGVFTALAFSAIVADANASPCDEAQTSSSTLQLNEPLTLVDVMKKIRNASPAARAAALEVQALRSEADQAGRRLNPNISLEMENFSGSGAFSGQAQSETTLAFEQTLRLGGKRKLNERAARAKEALSSAECSVILLEAQLTGAVLFAELIAASKLKNLAIESADLSDQLAGTVKRRVDAGAAAPPELLRARADAAAARASVSTASANVNQLRYELALLWGSANPTFKMDISSNTLINSSIDNSIKSHPALDAADAALVARQAERDLAKSAAIPDLTVSAGLRRFEETGEQAVIAGISIPFPIFDRGRDAVRAASFRRDAATLSRTVTEQRLLSQKRAAVSSRKAAQKRLDILTSEALPAAEEAYTAAVKGYEIGRFDLTTTLDARATLIETRSALIEADFALQSQDMRLRALIGATPFDGEIQ